MAVMGCVVNGPGEAKEADTWNRRRNRRGTSDQKRRNRKKSKRRGTVIDFKRRIVELEQGGVVVGQKIF